MTKHIFIYFKLNRGGLYFENELMFYITPKNRWLSDLPIYRARNIRDEELAIIHHLPKKSTGLFADVQFKESERPVCFYKNIDDLSQIIANHDDVKYTLDFSNPKGSCKMFINDELSFDCFIKRIDGEGNDEYQIEIDITEIQIRNLLKLFCFVFPVVQKWIGKSIRT